MNALQEPQREILISFNPHHNIVLISQLSVFDILGELGGGAGDRTRDLGCNPVCHPGHMDCQLLIPSNSLEIC